MKYELTTPCGDCPFRNDIPAYLRGGRVLEITRGNAEFACHKTTVPDPHDEEGGLVANDESQHCAGLLILLEKEERPHQMMRICERLGSYDARRLNMEAPVYDSIAEAVRAHRKACGHALG